MDYLLISALSGSKIHQSFLTPWDIDEVGKTKSLKVLPNLGLFTHITFVEMPLKRDYELISSLWTRL